VNALFQQLAQPHADTDYPAVKLLPLWHGTNPNLIDSICKTGYANLAKTDSGYFGKGIYSSHEAEYAYRVFSEGALVLNWVAVFSAYPVIHGDTDKLEEKANYQNYDAHFVPVVPQNPNDPDESIYNPCKPNQPHQYTEVVVFESAQCLPRYLVELQPSLPAIPPHLSGVPAPASVGVNPHGFFSPAKPPAVPGQSIHAAALAKAAQYAYDYYLSKPYTAPGGSDREYTYHGTTIHRPNHGLVHTLHCAMYGPFVVEFYNQLHPANKLSQDDIECIQMALVFHVAGRRNDMSSKDNPALYQEAREASGRAFDEYAKNNLSQKFSDAKRALYANAILKLNGIGAENAIHLVMYLCHYLDLPRCLEKDICDDIFKQYVPYFGQPAIEQLCALADHCIVATGDRHIEKQGYNGKIFVPSSYNVNTCIANINKGIQAWQAAKVSQNLAGLIL
jgi:hypothetical protein